MAQRVEHGADGQVPQGDKLGVGAASAAAEEELLVDTRKLCGNRSSDSLKLRALRAGLHSGDSPTSDQGESWRTLLWRDEDALCDCL